MSSGAATTATRFDPDAARGAPLVEIRRLTKLYKIETGFVKKKSVWLSAVEDFNATIARGETLGLVGESAPMHGSSDSSTG